jgi:hypothetical protein|tara:strand:+ start:3129 stop:3281 length:153 start_codon:yes stop_codon:yes gene_type:complete
MGKSSEEFMKQRERFEESIPLLTSSFNWDQYFLSLHTNYLNKIKNEEGNI